METAKRKGQARLRLVVKDEGSEVGYKSGRSRWREMPDAASMGRTRSAGTRPDASQPDTVPCDLSPSLRARALWPPTASHAARNASVDIRLINAQTVNSVNANPGNDTHENRRMAKRPSLPASPFWKRLEEALGDKPAWQPFNANYVATRLKKSQGSVHRWYTGQGYPELDQALALAKEGGVCIDWLLNAVKPKYPISKDPTLRRLLEICEDLPKEGRSAVLRSAEGELLRKQQEEFAAQEAAKKKA